MAGLRLPSMNLGLVAAFLLISVNSSAALKCYKFTWAGTVNETIDCDDYMIDNFDEQIPCKYPIIYTEPGYLPPDLEDLKDHCSKYTCPKYDCETDTEICLRYSWFDVNDKIHNYTSFCGTLADVTKVESAGAVPVTNGCWKQKMGTFTREVCACDNESLCNESSALVASLTLLSLVSFLVHLLAKLDLIY